MQFVLVPVIIGVATGGTIGILKLIQTFFPDARKTIEKTEEWIEKHK